MTRRRSSATAVVAFDRLVGELAVLGEETSRRLDGGFRRGAWRRCEGVEGNGRKRSEVREALEKVGKVVVEVSKCFRAVDGRRFGGCLGNEDVEIVVVVLRNCKRAEQRSVSKWKVG